MTIDIGAFRDKVLLQRLVETPTGTGGSAKTWQDIGPEWANIRHQTGAEVMRGEVPVSVAKQSIRIRFRADIDATCRVVYEGAIFDIRSVLPDLVTREYVDLVCETGQNEG